MLRPSLERVPDDAAVDDAEQQAVDGVERQAGADAGRSGSDHEGIEGLGGVWCWHGVGLPSSCGCVGGTATVL
ncbi:hypothetical protein Q9Q99_17005 [Curtobacterium flaccumfaciens]|nr:hypothetical protein Q9Q99_17005 [Curtobacterium flaccumfaciens]